MKDKLKGSGDILRFKKIPTDKDEALGPYGLWSSDDELFAEVADSVFEVPDMETLIDELTFTARLNLDEEDYPGARDAARRFVDHCAEETGSGFVPFLHFQASETTECIFYDADKNSFGLALVEDEELRECDNGELFERLIDRAFGSYAIVE